MFESISTFEDDDLELDTSFTPIYSSTQDSKCQKRQSDTLVEETVKKIKVDTKGPSINSPFIRNSSSDKFERVSSFSSPDRVVKRMFPGPAGLLADNFKNSELVCKNPLESREDFLFCSQSTVLTFAEGPWKMMKEDFYKPNVEQLFEKYTISWIKKNYSHNRSLNNYKAPFLAALIQNLDKVDGKIPSVHITLKDTTGTIDATILYSFYNENSNYLKTGSVIVLKQFGVLTSQEGHCLTITANNLLVIYHSRNSKVQEETEKLDERDVFEKIILQNYTADEIWEEANAVGPDKNFKSTCQRIVNEKPNFSNIHRIVKRVPPCNKNAELSSTISNPNSVLNINKFILPTVQTMNVTRPSSSNFKSSDVLNLTDKCDRTPLQSIDKKQYNFKNVNSVQQQEENLRNVENNILKSKNVTVQADNRNIDIWKTMLEDIDVDSLFDDF